MEVQRAPAPVAIWRRAKNGNIVPAPFTFGRGWNSVHYHGMVFASALEAESFLEKNGDEREEYVLIPYITS